LDLASDLLESHGYEPLGRDDIYANAPALLTELRRQSGGDVPEALPARYTSEAACIVTFAAAETS